jgi:gamma-glutamyl-gamma-aminobutyrate hydrolase PuuD
MTNEAEAYPTIGVIASRYPRAGGNSILAGIGEQYLRAVEAGGGIPLVIHLTRDAAVIQAHYTRCDGLLFAGGGDVDPAILATRRTPSLAQSNRCATRLSSRWRVERLMIVSQCWGFAVASSC